MGAGSPRIEKVLAGISDPRTRRMAELYAAGLTQAEVADRIGVSRERVRYLLRETGLPMRSKREAHALRRERITREGREEINTTFAECRNITEVVRRLGIPRRIVEEVVHESFSPAERRLPVERRRKWRQRFTDEELLDFLRAAASGADTVTVDAYTEHARNKQTPDGRSWPVQTTFYKRFGSWRAAVAAAGLAQSPGPQVGKRKFEEVHCVDALRAAALALGETPTAEDYDAFARSFGGAYPSVATVRNCFGTWFQALTAAEL